MLGIVRITIIYPAPYRSIPTVELNTALVSSGARPTRRRNFLLCLRLVGSAKAHIKRAPQRVLL